MSGATHSDEGQPVTIHCQKCGAPLAVVSPCNTRIVVGNAIIANQRVDLRCVKCGYGKRWKPQAN